MSNTWVKLIKSLHALSGVSKVILFTIIALLLAVHLLLTFCNKDFTWLAAFGAWLSIFGLLTSFSYSFPFEEIDRRDLEPTEVDEQYVEGGMEFADLITDQKKIDEIKAAKVAAIVRKYKNIFVYFIFTIIGTLLWAYAGFLNNVFYKSVS